MWLTATNGPHAGRHARVFDLGWLFKDNAFKDPGWSYRQRRGRYGVGEWGGAILRIYTFHKQQDTLLFIFR